MIQGYLLVKWRNSSFEWYQTIDMNFVDVRAWRAFLVTTTCYTVNNLDVCPEAENWRPLRIHGKLFLYLVQKVLKPKDASLKLFPAVYPVVDSSHLSCLYDEQYGSFCWQETANFYILVTKGGRRWWMLFALFMKEMAAQTPVVSLSPSVYLLLSYPCRGIPLATVEGDTSSTSRLCFTC